MIHSYFDCALQGIGRRALHLIIYSLSTMMPCRHRVTMLLRGVVVAALLAAGLPMRGAESLMSLYDMSQVDMSRGLPSNYVDDLHTDSYGFVWLATNGGGLVRYDGYTLRYFGVGSGPLALRSNSCHGIAEDRYRRLWVSFEEYTAVIDLTTLRPSTQMHDDPRLRQVLSEQSAGVLTDATGAVWVATRRHVYRLTFGADGEVATVMRTSHRGTMPTVVLADVESNGRPWVAIDGTLCQLSAEGGRLVKRRSPMALALPAGATVLSMLRYDGRTWVGTTAGLVSLDQRTRRVATYGTAAGNLRLSHACVTALAVSPHGRLLVGTLAGVDVMDVAHGTLERWNVGSAVNPLPSNFVSSIMVHRGQVWVGTETGGAVWLGTRRLRLRTYRHSEAASSLSAGNVNAMYAQPDGTLWVGTVEGGLNRLRPGSEGFDHLTTATSRLSHNSVSVLTADGQGTLWVGTWGGGVNVMPLASTADLRPLALPAAYAVETAFVGAIAYDALNQGMWLGCNAGLFFYDLRTGTISDPFPGCREVRGCIGAAIDREGWLWMGSIEGVVKVNLRSPRRAARRFEAVRLRHKLDQPESGIIDKVCAVFVDSRGTLWLGSNGYGLYRRTRDARGREVFKAYTTVNGLANNVVRGITESANHLLWVATDNGLSQFNPETEVFTNYTTDDGLLSSQFYWNAALRAPQGKLCFATDRGLIIVDGDNPPPAAHVQLRFSRLTVDNQEVMAGSRFLDTDIALAPEVRLREGDKSVSIEFSALNYGSERHGTYSYRLRGFEDEWEQLRPGEHSVRYTSLPAGSYEFEVRYGSAHSQARGEMISLTIHVSPHFYKSWWFVTLVLVGLVLAARYLYEWRVTELRRRTAENLIRPIEAAISESEDPGALQQRIEKILSNQRSIKTSLTKSVEADRQETVVAEVPFVDQLTMAMERHYGDSTFGVAELADALHVSRASLSKRVTAVTGMATTQFMRNYRLDVASRLLVANVAGRNITEIAYRVGFNDPKYFTRCFTRKFGISPSEYKGTAPVSASAPTPDEAVAEENAE